MLANARIHRIGLTVSSYPQAMRFYTRMLGLVPVWDNPAEKNAGFRVDRTLLVVHEGKSSGASGGIRIYFTVFDISKELDELRESGVACTAIRDYPDYQVVEFSDPDGNRLAIMQNKSTYQPVLESQLGRKLTE